MQGSPFRSLYVDCSSPGCGLRPLPVLPRGLLPAPTGGHMRLTPSRPRAALVAVAAALLTGSALASAPALASSAAHGSGGHQGNEIRHVLLISVDGMHQQDLTWYVRTHPDSALASLMHHGLEYSRAMTPFPSDSFPGMVGQVTGGDPGVTGVYYDDTWNHSVFPAGTTTCSGPAPGGEVSYTEAADINQNSIDAGQGLSGLPGSILQ